MSDYNLMNLSLDSDSLEQVTKITEEIEECFFDIPFGNTAFQTKAFVISATITPERSFRQIGLQLLSVLDNIRNLIINNKIQDVKIKQKQHLLNSGTLDIFEKEIVELELIRETTGDMKSKKHLNDLLNEFFILNEEFQKMPKFTREQFEAAEMNYFTQSLNRQMSGITGPIESLINMQEDMKALNEYKEKLKMIENLDTETMESLRLSMSNQIENAKKSIENAQNLKTPDYSIKR